MSAASQRESVIRVALSVLNRDGWSTESGKNTSGFIMVRDRERLLVVGHGRWEITQEERDQLYGRLLRLYTKHPDASRGVIVLPETTSNVDEVSEDVRRALGVELAIVNPAKGTMQWNDAPAVREFVNLDETSASATTGGVFGRLRRIFR